MRHSWSGSPMASMPMAPPPCRSNRPLMLASAGGLAAPQSEAGTAHGLSLQTYLDNLGIALYLT